MVSGPHTPHPHTPHGLNGIKWTIYYFHANHEFTDDNYFLKYPGIKEYMNNTIAFAKENGFVETI